MLQLASDVVDGCARGSLVDPDFPLQLGQHRHSRRLHLTDVAVNMHSDEWHDLKPGQIYTIFGASTPVNKNGMWHIQMPRATRGTAVIHNLGWGNGILANKLDSEHESACTTSCAEQVSTSPPVDDEPHGDLCFGLIDLVGATHVLPPPAEPMKLQQWLQPWVQIPWERLWLTHHGHPISKDMIVDDKKPICVQLRFGLRSGGKHQGDLKRLEQLLVLRGVPEQEAPSRANKVLELTGLEALQSAMASLEPWRQLKQIVGQKMRLVLPKELQVHKNSGKAAQDRGEDPLAACDPWAQALAAKAENPVELRFDESFFLDQSDCKLPVINQLTVGGKGAVLASRLDTEVFAKLHGVSSDDELVAVVVGNSPPQVGQLPCSELTFPAWHGKCKILLRGFAVNFGKVMAKSSPTLHCFDLSASDQTVISLEIRREYVQDWDLVTSNPFRYATDNVSGLQGSIKSSWFKRFFQGRKVAQSPAEAQTWHGFARIDHEQLQSLLKQSGTAGIFLTPKDDDSNMASGKYKIVWLPSADLSESLTVMKSFEEARGLVRGKTTLGLRVQAEQYSSVRSRVEPTWRPDSDLVNIVVEKRWLITPVPQATDRSTLLALFEKLGWRAVPLRQINGSTWVVGSSKDSNPPSDTFSLGGQLVLITEQQPVKPPLSRDTVVAGPPAVKRALDRQLAGQHVQLVSSASSSGSTTVVTTSSGPTRALVEDLKADMCERFKELQVEFGKAINEVQNRCEQLEATCSEQVAEIRDLNTETVDTFTRIQETQTARIEQLESSVAHVSQNCVSKTDLQSVLAEALEKQNRDLRALLFIQSE